MADARKKNEANECTGQQWSYIKILMREAFSKGYKNTPNLDVHHMPTYYTKLQASADIKRLIEAKQNNWK